MEVQAPERQHSLAQYRVPGLPSSMYYITNFITEEEEKSILESVRKVSRSADILITNCVQISPNKWISLTKRRLQAVPARLTASNTLVSNTELPNWLTTHITKKFTDLGLFIQAPHGQANHCLINEYLPGQGIMPHEDGAAYHPIVATVSLSGTLVLDVTSKPTTNNEQAEVGKRSWRILQEPRSLLVTTDEAYTDTLHGIAEISEDIGLGESYVANWSLLGDEVKSSIRNAGGVNKRETRVSLTFRDVLKVSTLGSKIFGKPRG